MDDRGRPSDQQPKQFSVVAIFADGSEESRVFHERSLYHCWQWAVSWGTAQPKPLRSLVVHRITE